MANVDALFTPLPLGGTTLRNRLQMAALTRNRAAGGRPTALMREYYAQRARGGAGMLVSEGLLVARQGCIGLDHAPGIWDPAQADGWRDITDAVRAEGAVMYAQMMHWGRGCHPDAPQQRLSGDPVYGPSAIAIRPSKPKYPGHKEPEFAVPTPIEDPWVFVEKFRVAAENAKAAGFDGVELIAGGGFLVAQFLETASNQRTDEWGGSAENRARFALEILKALKTVFGGNVGVKVTPGGGMNDVGMPLQDALDTYRYFLVEADKLGVAYITLVRYSARSDVEIDGKLRGTEHDVLESYRDSIKDAKVFLCGGVSAEEGARLVKAGRIDGVANGFAWIAHPDVAHRIRQGKPLDNVPDFKHLQSGGPDESEWGRGYTDYPAAD